ncbi:MAG TPA: response regulator [Bryobacteraceae bacterium]|jgi:two-component system alkaline phosphatase synthesis response regulator PhoP|nr:response regulator [Bryobacteraceae bacterium]
MTILLVDDEPALVALFSDCLRRAGYDVKEAFDGDHALSLFVESPQSFALVISDIHMPNISGTELARFVASHDCPVLLVSGGAIPPEVGAEGWNFLTKPLLPQTLVSAVAKILKRKRSVRADHPEIPGALSA